MKKIKKLTALLLTGALCFSVCVPAMAHDDVGDVTEFPQPEQDDLESLDDVELIRFDPATESVETSDSMVDDFGIATLAVTSNKSEWDSLFNACVEEMREGFKEKEDTITVEMQVWVGHEITADEANEIAQEIALEVFAKAREHTGDPMEGDYLVHQSAGSLYVGGSYAKEDGYVYPTIWISDTCYYTTVEEDKSTMQSVDDLIANFNWSACESDYAKVCDVYDWMCLNVTYDWDYYYAVQDGGDLDLGKHTAYNLFTERTAVCQGYAVAMYCILLEEGIDNRIVSGYSTEAKAEEGGLENHAWNIVKLGDEYYNIDATWDADNYYNGRDYHAYFLLCNENFTQSDTVHIRGASHASGYNQNLSAYTMSETDFDAETNPAADSSHDIVTDAAVAATCTENGLTEGKHCTNCGEIIVAQEVVSATGHTLVTVAATDATDESDGNIEYQYCTVCGAYFAMDGTEIMVEDTIIQATGESADSDGTAVSASNGKSGEIDSTEGVKTGDSGMIYMYVCLLVLVATAATVAVIICRRRQSL